MFNRKLSLAVVFLFFACVFADYPKRDYQLYEPQITRHYIYKASEDEDRFSYNHCASIEYFDGFFYAVWQANYKNVEGFPGRRIWLARSKDGKIWSEPMHFTGEGSYNPITPSAADSEMQSQPNLLNYKGKELWCSWCIRGFKGQSGTYLSILKSSSDKWRNRKIMNTHKIGDWNTYAYPSQNMVMLKSGRVLMPVTFDTLKTIEGVRYPVMFNGFLYSDDDGQSWKASNPITLTDNVTGQWEPCVHQQADGKVRYFSRNFCENVERPDRWLLTGLGSGVNKGEELRFDPDARYSYIETANTRMHCIPISGNRWVLIHHDVYVDNRSYESRYGGALFFSRTGEDDFTAGPSFTLEDTVTAYPQGLEHDGKLYIAYTRGGIYNPRSLMAACVEPLPDADKFYIWPRDKEVIKLARRGGQKGFTRVNDDYVYKRPYQKTMGSKNVLVFEERGSAGVETDPVDFQKGEKLCLSFDYYIEKVQNAGNLILFTFGDQIPIRAGVPSGRNDKLYVWCKDQWQEAGSVKLKKWTSMNIVFGAEYFTIKSLSGEEKRFGNPIFSPNRRLYLGDGYEIDVFESNRNSVFYIDIDSIKTKVM